MNKPIHHRTDRSKPYPFPLLSKHDLKRYPTITDIAGFTVHVDEQGCLWGRRKTIGKPATKSEIDRAIELLLFVQRIQTPSLNSYGLKNEFERITKCGHIWNGSLILGAAELGIRQQWIIDSPNTRMAISRKWLTEFRMAGKAKDHP